MQLKRSLVIRYPVLIRLGLPVVCALLAVGIMRSPVRWMTIATAFGAVCLAAAVLAYRAEVNEKEISIRHAPFFTRHIPVGDVVSLIEGKSLILVTSKSRIPLWGLSIAERRVLLQFLPHHLDSDPSSLQGENDSGIRIRRHLRWTLFAALGFAASLGLFIPFLQGFPWNEYANSIGKYVLIICFAMLGLLLWQAGMTWVYWSYKRDIGRITHGPHHKRG